MKLKSAGEITNDLIKFITDSLLRDLDMDGIIESYPSLVEINKIVQTPSTVEISTPEFDIAICFVSRHK